MILRTQIRPDRFWCVISGRKKEHRIPFNHIELTEKKYEVVILTTSFSREALIELLSIEEDKQAGEYVLKLGKIKSTKNIKNELKYSVSSVQEVCISHSEEVYRLLLL